MERILRGWTAGKRGITNQETKLTLSISCRSALQLVASKTVIVHLEFFKIADFMLKYIGLGKVSPGENESDPFPLALLCLTVQKNEVTDRINSLPI